MTLALLATAFSMGLLVKRNIDANKRPKGDLWFYNLKTRQLFAASDLSVPPIDTASGPGTGVRAHVLACATGPGADSFIAFLEKLTPEMKQEAEAEVRQTRGQMGLGFALEKRQAGILVSAVEEEKWVPKFSPEGSRIMEAGRMKGGCPHPIPSLP